jgi:circadian clock protein KaiB
VTATAFDAELIRSGSETIIRLRGELEDESAAQARDAFQQALSDPPQRLLIDLSGLEFMGSTGIWLIVEAHRRCVEAGIELRLHGKPLPAVAQALALSGMEELAGPGPRAFGTEDGSSDGDSSADGDAPAGAGSPAGVESRAGGGDQADPVELRLYLSSRSSGVTPVVSTVQSLIERLPSADVQLEVVDVFEDPARAKQDRVIATPTLIKTRPAPELRLIGSIGDPDAVLRHLGLAHLTAQR